MTEQLNWTELAWGHLESHYRGLSVHWGQMPQTSLTDRRGPEKVTATSLRPPLQLPPLHPRRGGDCLFDSRSASQLKSCERRAGEGGEAHPLGQAAILRQFRDKNRYQNNPAFSPLFQTSHLCPTKGEANTWIPQEHTHQLSAGPAGNRTGWPSDSALSTGRSQSDGRSRPQTVKDREAWWAAVHRVAKSRTQLSNWTTKGGKNPRGNDPWIGSMDIPKLAGQGGGSTRSNCQCKGREATQKKSRNSLQF